MSRFLDEELASIMTEPHVIEDADFRYQAPGEKWQLDRLAEDEYQRREYGHEYKLTRMNSIRQGWVCGTFSKETAAKLAMMLARQVELDA